MKPGNFSAFTKFASDNETHYIRRTLLGSGISAAIQAPKGQKFDRYGQAIGNEFRQSTEGAVKGIVPGAIAGSVGGAVGNALSKGEGHVLGRAAAGAGGGALIGALLGLGVGGAIGSLKGRYGAKATKIHQGKIKETEIE